jgi:hypothetical protein
MCNGPQIVWDRNQADFRPTLIATKGCIGTTLSATGPTFVATEPRTSASHALTRPASLRRALLAPPLCSMSIPQENKVFLDVPSHDK